MLRYPAKAKRREPAQKRALDTVDCIVTAAERILEGEGIEAATVERIAVVAGVGVGTVYEYFPTRQGVLLEVSVRATEREREAVAREALAAAGVPLADAFRRLLGVLFASMKQYAELRRWLLETFPTRPRADEVGDDLETPFVQTVTAFLTSRAGETRRLHPQITAHVMVAALDGVIEMLLESKPELLGTDELLDELTLLCTGFVAGKPPPMTTSSHISAQSAQND